MSNSEQSERIVAGHQAVASEGTGWTLLRFGWPALLIGLGLGWGMVVLSVSAEEGIAPVAHALSAEALAQGRWIVVFSHVFLPPDLMVGMVLCAVAFIAGLTTPALRDPDWMGGWRLLAVFALAVVAVDIVHFLVAPTPMLQGPWPAMLAVIVWLILAGRLPKAPRRGVGEAEPSPNEVALGSALQIAFALIFLMQALQQGYDGWRVDPSPGLAAAVSVGGGLLAYGASRFGGRIGRRLSDAAFVVLWSIVLGDWVVRMWPRLGELAAGAQALRWETWIAALAVGAAAGLLERHAARARRQG